MAKPKQQPAKGKAKTVPRKPPRTPTKSPEGKTRAKATAVRTAASRAKRTPTKRTPPKRRLAAPKRRLAPPKRRLAAPKRRLAPPKRRLAPPKQDVARAKRRTSIAGVRRLDPSPDTQSTLDAVPEPIAETSSSGTGRRTSTARERSMRASPVVEILDDPHPIGALRRFLDSIKGAPTVQQGQIALGAAQLLLSAIARENRGGADVKDVVDMMLERWTEFPEPTGFHAQELLRHALAAVGVDRERIGRLHALIPSHASAELLLNLACAHAVARDKVAMLGAVDAALDAGVTATQFRRDPDFAPYQADPDLALLLSRADIPQIPVDLEPSIGVVRRALDSLIGTLREYGARVELRPPARLDAILDAERACKISLPNDFRALLTLTNGMKVWDHEFFGIGDFREPTSLSVRAQSYLEMSASSGATAFGDCIPIACSGGPSDWLLYDPRGNVRGNGPGYVVTLEADERPLDDLAGALDRLEQLAREVFGTN